MVDRQYRSLFEHSQIESVHLLSGTEVCLEVTKLMEGIVPRTYHDATFALGITR